MKTGSCAAADLPGAPARRRGLGGLRWRALLAASLGLVAAASTSVPAVGRADDWRAEQWTVEDFTGVLGGGPSNGPR